MPELDQPLMVVVLVVIARTATPAKVADAVFGANGRAANMGRHCTGRRCMRLVDQPSAFTTASPICDVPTLVVPSL